MIIADYLDQVINDDPAITDELLSLIAPTLIPDGLILEFGVATGRSLREINEKLGNNRAVFGFDSWKGLPEFWREGYDVGMFAGQMPTDMPDNVTLYEGWFENTVLQFHWDYTEDIAFLHMDADLYSSTIYVLNTLNNQIVQGTYIMFDELWYPDNYKDHEYKAIVEWVTNHDRAIEFVGRRHEESFCFRVVK